MSPFPLVLSDFLGHWGSYIVYFLIGIAFGAVLEASGFSDSRRLAAQFYFKDMTVLKVMFTGIVVAMLLIFLTSALGLLDYNLVWVNPTYLIPGIVGGLIMGVGFIIGGFCPGTSLVAAATFKLDGLFFALGAFFGIFVFGETVGWYDAFWHSTNMGRYTLPELFGVPTGVVVVGVTLMALGAFWAAEQAEGFFNQEVRLPKPKWRYAAAGVLVLIALATLGLGQPSNADRWARMAKEKEAALTARRVQIHPGELLALTHNNQLITRVLDVRSEADYNRFHLLDAEHLPQAAMDAETVEGLLRAPANTVFVLVSNDEDAATEAWRYLVAEGLPNLYILEGGMNFWLDTFADPAFREANLVSNPRKDSLHYRFNPALGSRHPAANPNPEAFELTYTEKVQLQSKRAGSGGGCG